MGGIFVLQSGIRSSTRCCFHLVKVSLHCFLSDQVAACITVPEGCEHFQSIFRNQGSFVVWQVLKTEVFINYQEYELQQILQGAFESGGSWGRRRRVWDKRLSPTQYPSKEKPFFIEILPEDQLHLTDVETARELVSCRIWIENYPKQGKTV